SPRNLALSNAGEAALLRIAAVSVTGGNSGDFQVTANGCGAPVGPGRSCSLEVIFDPTAMGGRAASLVIPLSEGNAPPLVVPLAGTGVDKRPPVLTSRDLVVEASSKDGAIVRYLVSAADDVDGKVPVDCQPVSGTWFPFGTTHVGCTATDNSG